MKRKKKNENNIQTILDNILSQKSNEYIIINLFNIFVLFLMLFYTLIETILKIKLNST